MKGLLWRAAVIVSIALLPTCAYLIGNRTADNTRAIDRNHGALAYICATTSVLDDLVKAARDQINANFENGTYRKLKQRGILTKANVRAARETLVQYRAAHWQLQANGACDGL